MVTDFGRFYTSNPRLIMRAHSEADVANAFKSATKRGLTVGIKGAGHTCGGQTANHGGVLLENRIRGPVERLSEDEFEVATGSTWHDVEIALNSLRRSVPVVPNVLQLTVGGTLSVGGYGGNSVVRGGQIDHVTGFRLLTPDGRTHWCSPDSNQDLFRYSLAGLGQLGFISRVRLRTVPFAQWTSIGRYDYRSLNDLAESLAWANESDAVLPPYFIASAVDPGTGATAWYGDEHPGNVAALTAVRAAAGPPAELEITELRRLHEHVSVNEWVAQFDDWSKFWVDYGFTYPAFVQFCARVQEMTNSRAFRTGVLCAYVAIVEQSPHGNGAFPFDIRPDHGGRTFTCGLYCAAPPGDEETLTAVRKSLDELLELVLALNGRPYVYGCDDMPRSRWSRAFGETSMKTLEALRHRVDPAQVLVPPWRRQSGDDEEL